MALDTLISMAVFRDAIDHGSLTAAARGNGLSAEMAGRHLVSLETRLGVRLINRSTRKLSLTEAGRVYLERCRAILDEVSHAEANVGALQAAPQGHLRVAAPLAFATAVLAPALDVYQTRYEKVSVQLDLSEREVDLITAGFDVALRLGDLPDTALVARKLGEFPLILVASPRYLERHPAPATPEALADHDFLIYTQTATPDRLTLWNEQSRRSVVKVSGTTQASDIGFLLELALLDRGLLLAPSFVVDQHLKAGRLIHVLPQWAARVLPFHALVPHRNLMPATVRSFIDFMADWFKP
ncbi:LysR family transcriptional regulator [Bordetella sp. N]|uniref:LysR family transcriptional regulator n=1 Tax=Bordetella sp. N TaxID=1746199 RepID=UPI00070BF5CC|nr:LysR family transcriptional regulator [Bordetella sp. N]ALM84121.1 hypothetical protein ASB57_15100 [Bordetella sp. N]